MNSEQPYILSGHNLVGTNGERGSTTWGERRGADNY